MCMTFGQDEISTLNARIWEQGVQIDRLKAELAAERARREAAERERDGAIGARNRLLEEVGRGGVIATVEPIARPGPAPADRREELGRVAFEAWWLAYNKTYPNISRNPLDTWDGAGEEVQEWNRRIADAVLAAARPGEREATP